MVRNQLHNTSSVGNMLLDLHWKGTHWKSLQEHRHDIWLTMMYLICQGLVAIDKFGILKIWVSSGNDYMLLRQMENFQLGNLGDFILPQTDRIYESQVSGTHLSQCKTPGGALGYLGGRIRSLSKLKNTPKALISGQKSTLILIKTRTFSTK